MFVCFIAYVCYFGFMYLCILVLMPNTQVGLWVLGFRFMIYDLWIMYLDFRVQFLAIRFQFLVISFVYYDLCSMYWVYGFMFYALHTQVCGLGVQGKLNTQGGQGGTPPCQDSKAERLSRFLGRSPKPPEVPRELCLLENMSVRLLCLLAWFIAFWILLLCLLAFFDVVSRCIQI